MNRPAIAAPALPEIAIGLLGMAVFGIGLAFLVVRLPIAPVATGLIMTALSGIGGLAGFFGAYWLRVRQWRPFGIRKTTPKWLLIALGAGIVTFILKGAAIMAYMSLTGDGQNIQQVYGQGGSGGAGSLILATLLLGVLTPIGEEFLFRGVITNALLRYGPVAGVVGGALIFALVHGINPVFPAALVVGLVAGEIFRRSGSIWPPVVVHSVVNLPTVPLLVLAGATG